MPPALFTTTALWAALAPVVTVQGDAICPTAADVATRLAALLPARETTEPPDVARIDLRGSTLVLTLTRADGSPIGERTLDGGFPCADLASAAAVVVATWESDVHPEFRLPPAPEPPAPPPPPPAPARPAVRTAPPPSFQPAASWDVGAALAASVAPAAGQPEPALGLLLVGSWTPGGARLGGRLALVGAAARELPLGAGQVQWQRAAAAAGPQLRVPLEKAPWVVDLHAEGLMGWLVASGQGFSRDLRDGSLDPGLGAGVRLLRASGGLETWLELSGTAWLRRLAAYATPGAASVAIPRFEALVAVGVGLGSRP
jgi:hypothetical protein